jgi:hypothetical protein
MKKIFSVLMTAAFVLALGAAYAGSLSNGITDFSGRSSDTFEIVPGVPGLAAMERSQGAMTASNGVSDFSGGSYDTFAIGSAPAGVNSVEGVSAGGLRDDKTPAYNGVTDFLGRSRDTGALDR